MKKLSLILLSFLFIQSIQAQDQKEGYIRYTETIKMDMSEMKGLENLPEEIRAQIPDQQEMQHILYFNENEMLFSNYSEEEKDQNINYSDPDNNLQIEMNFEMPEYKQYTDLKSNKFVESQELFGKRFLIKGKHDKKKWKMTTEIKTILGYPCQKATTEGEKGTIEVWYTIAIPAKVGPREYHQLAGAVLEVSMEEGRQIIRATQVEFEKLEEETITVPKKGKKVSKEEFKKIMEEKTKEMQKMMGDGNMMIIETDDR
jgi:GLPGLI family protein